MKKNKNLFIILIIVFIVILSLLFLFNIKEEKQSENIVSNISDINEAYNVKICTEKFYVFYKEYREVNSKFIYEFLDKEYIEYYNLDKNNFIKKLDIIDSDQIHIDSILKIQQKSHISMYLIKATQLYKNSNDTKEFNIILKLDTINNVFSVFLNDYIIENGYNNLKVGDKVKISIKNIDIKDNNKYDYSKKGMTDNVEDIFSEYANMCIFYEKKAYEMIDNECKESKFINYETYDKYIIDNIIDIVNMRLLSYEYTQKDGYIEYKCKDNKGGSYIFKVTSYVTYTVIIE